MTSPLLITPPTVCTESWWTKPVCGERRSTALELVLGRGDPLLELGDLALRLAQVLEHLGAEILVDLDDLQLGFADLTARPGDVGDELAALALRSRLVALKLGNAGDGDETFLVKLGNPSELLLDELELGLFCRLLRRQAADLLVGLRDPLAQLRALAGARAASRLEQLLLAGHCRGRRRLLAAVRQLRRKHDGIGVLAFGQQPRLARQQFVEL